MPEEDQPKMIQPVLEVDATQTPSVYCNQIATSISFSDIRLYFAEVMPKDVNFTGPKGFKTREPHLRTHICVVMTPDFSRSLLMSLQEALERYESTFGPLRPAPTPEHVFKALNDPQAKG